VDTENFSPQASPGNIEKTRFNRKAITYLFFVVISTIAWLLIALNKEYTADVSYPVRYVNFPAGKVLVGDLPDRLTLSISSGGFTIIRYKLSSPLQPITFNVGSFSLNRVNREDATRFFLLTRLAREKVSQQLGTEIQVLQIRPDSLIFVFAEVVEKEVPVQPVLDLDFVKPYGLKGSVVTIPRKVVVSGPSVIVDTLTRIFTRPMKIARLKDTITRSLVLENVKYLSFSEKKIDVIIPVEKFTEVSMSIPIEAVNLPPDLMMKTFPGHINLSCLVALSDYESLKPFLFRAEVDYLQADHGPGNKLRVQLVKVPPTASSVKYTPRSVDFILER
jgi:hypothetical protein